MVRFRKTFYGINHTFLKSGEKNTAFDMQISIIFWKKILNLWKKWIFCMEKLYFVKRKYVHGLQFAPFSCEWTLVWTDKSSEKKIASERSSQQGIKGLNLIPLLKINILRFWGQSHEKKLYLIWGDNSNEIKFYSVRSSQQGLKGLKFILFAKNHCSAVLR